ncbi:MAG: hypothetical protein ABIB98_02605 [bacterium]
MNKEVIFSLKPAFAVLIESREKDHEFRKYLPKVVPSKIWFYVTEPVSALVYIAEVGSVIAYPETVAGEGVGNTDFNAGLKVSKHAFPILHLHKLSSPLLLEELRKQFGFTPPQAFAYVDRYPTLRNFVYGKGVTLVKVF